jgi:hypothetical protein
MDPEDARHCGPPPSCKQAPRLDAGWRRKALNGMGWQPEFLVNLACSFQREWPNMVSLAPLAAIRQVMTLNCRLTVTALGNPQLDFRIANASRACDDMPCGQLGPATKTTVTSIGLGQFVVKFTKQL